MVSCHKETEVDAVRNSSCRSDQTQTVWKDPKSTWFSHLKTQRQYWMRTNIRYRTHCRGVRQLSSNTRKIQTPICFRYCTVRCSSSLFFLHQLYSSKSTAWRRLQHVRAAVATASKSLSFVWFWFFLVADWSFVRVAHRLCGHGYIAGRQKRRQSDAKHNFSFRLPNFSKTKWIGRGSHLCGRFRFEPKYFFGRKCARICISYGWFSFVSFFVLGKGNQMAR